MGQTFPGWNKYLFFTSNYYIGSELNWHTNNFSSTLMVYITKLYILPNLRFSPLINPLNPLLPKLIEYPNSFLFDGIPLIVIPTNKSDKEISLLI